jgi:hypothetical protein
LAAGTTTTSSLLDEPGTGAEARQAAVGILRGFGLDSKEGRAVYLGHNAYLDLLIAIIDLNDTQRVDPKRSQNSSN